MEGLSDPKRTACVDGNDARALLACDETRELWTKILEGLCACLHAQQSRNFLPSIDHGRIGYFVKEWVDDVHAPAVAAYPRFQAALSGFVRAWKDPTSLAAGFGPEGVPSLPQVALEMTSPQVVPT